MMTSFENILPFQYTVEPEVYVYGFLRSHAFCGPFDIFLTISHTSQTRSTSTRIWNSAETFHQF